MVRIMQGAARAASLYLAIALVLMVEVDSSFDKSKEIQRLLDDILGPVARSGPEVTIKVVYCGGCGYGSRYRRLETELSDEFGDDEIAIVGESTPGITGYFEVSVNGNLIHSKKGGDAFVDSDAKKKKIFDAVRASMG
ncbi:selenoprotein W-like [Patiria miniata]|uniref:Selenoprotein W n=1 Tax=Patiria miniata TaxID=46514 RepID=A0A914BTY3_PATMI|nr:selenoprotein W-like [Patiria miniata]